MAPKTYLHQCEEDNVSDGGRWPGFHRCPREGHVERDGKWFCKTHDPVSVAAKRKAQEDKWSAEWDTRRRADLRRSILIEIAAPFTTEFLETHKPVIQNFIRELLAQGCGKEA